MTYYTLSGKGGRLLERMDDPRFQPKEIREFRGAESRYLLGAVGAKPTLLDVGSGTGRHSGLLSKQCSKILGIDVSPDAVELSKRRTFGMPNVEIRQGNLFELDFKNSFDCAIFMMCALGDFEAEPEVLRALLRQVKKDGGKVIFDLYSENSIKPRLELCRNVGFESIAVGGDGTITASPSFVSRTYDGAQIQELISAAGAAGSVERLCKIAYICNVQINAAQAKRKAPGTPAPRSTSPRRSEWTNLNLAWMPAMVTGTIATFASSHLAEQLGVSRSHATTWISSLAAFVTTNLTICTMWYLLHREKYRNDFRKLMSDSLKMMSGTIIAQAISWSVSWTAAALAVSLYGASNTLGAAVNKVVDWALFIPLFNFFNRKRVREIEREHQK